MLAGAPGVGKTRLAEEVLARADRAGRRTARAHGSQAARGIGFGAVAHLLPEELVAAPGMPNLIRAAAGALIGAEEGRSLLVAVDDAHHLDDASAALLHHLASMHQASLILTVRTGEPAADPVVLLWKDGLCERLELQPLAREQVAEILEAVLGGQVEGATLHRLSETTRGNPLYLRELVLGGVESGALTRRAGVWRWSGPVGISGWLTQLIEMRLAGLDPAERETLEVIAAAEVLEARLLGRVAPLPTLGSLEQRGLVTEITDRRRVAVRLAHPLYTEALHGSTPPARSRAIKKALADALEATGLRRRQDLLRLGAWRLESGAAGSPEVMTEAARRAVGIQDHRLAERLARAAVEAGGGFQPRMLVAQSLIGQGKLEEGDAELARTAAEAPDEVSRAIAAGTRAQNLFWGLGRSDAAVQVMAEVEATARIPAVRDEIAAGRAFFLFYQARTREAMDLAQEVLARPDVPPRAVFLALEPYANGLWMQGRPSEGLALLDGRREEFEEGAREFPLAPVVVPALRTYCAHSTGDLTEMVRAWDDLNREALEAGADWIHGIHAFVAGWAARAQGTPRTAARRLRDAVPLIKEADVFGYIQLAWAELAHSRALLGDVAEAEEALEEAKAVTAPGIVTLRAHVGLAGAWTAAARGEISAGIEMALEEADAADAMGNLAYELWALHDAARLGAARRVAERIAHLASPMEGPLADAYASHATALAGDDAPALEAASTAFERIGLWLLAAEAVAEAERAYERAGTRGRALAARARAAALIARCEGARTPALAELENPLPLTAREREVAALAAAGLTNREIARRLVVSVRTVDNHLHAVYGKLGISGRDDLPGIFEPPLLR